ncbi:MAG: tRNA (guanosine(46)-N7)-methyltransferase TrmB [Verrucomicrobia bacterium]|nr:tRNA (guanosine(46)-N7)-methyltransferase TrmB [Verrucomicrobiota bacterium]MDE3097874.1 tRNA (guanosine(46)-N7)-methyltransferase TrmB [Verrucomicrobiota bacterium]
MSTLIFQLRSIVERIDLAEWFPKPQPLEIELGCGDGSFLAEYARRHPERNFIGVERLLGRLSKLDRKGRRAGLTNLRGARIESSYFLKFLLPPRAAETVHVYFPDPWPKKRHQRHRLVTEQFADAVAATLRPGGWIHFRTDDPNYFGQIRAIFDASGKFRKREAPRELLELPTDFELDFLSKGIQTLRVSYQDSGIGFGGG